VTKAWRVLTAPGLRLVHACDGVDAVSALTDLAAPVVIATVPLHLAVALPCRG